jgi:hypothetical protein
MTDIDPGSKGVPPVLLEGQTVEVTGGEYKGRMGVVRRHQFATTADLIQFMTPAHPKRMFAKVDRYVLVTRDSRNELISVPASDVKAIDSVGGWARGQAPEEAPGGEGFEARKRQEEKEAEEASENED